MVLWSFLSLSSAFIELKMLKFFSTLMMVSGRKLDLVGTLGEGLKI